MKHIDNASTIFIIDGSSFLYRAYYALRPMNTPQGVPVGAVYGFCKMLKKLLNTFKPRYITIAWDSPGKTERHTIFPNYKATREAPPSDIFIQKGIIQGFANTIGIRQVARDGIEADDLMHALALDFTKQGFSVVLVTADKDLGQIVSDSISLFDPFKDVMYNPAALEEKYGFAATKLPFYFALIGDSSDNIPGVTGIGPKGATDLVKQFASLHDMYENIDQIKRERIRELLHANKDEAFLSEQLFLLRYYELQITPDMCTFDMEQWNLAASLFKELAFKSLLTDMPAADVVALSELHGFTFTTITQQQQLEAVCGEICAAGYCAIDTETDSLKAYQANLVGISLSSQVGVAYYIPLSHTEHSEQLSKTIIFNILKPVLENTAIKKYLHHAKFDQLVLSNYGIELQGIVFDTLIAAHLIKSDQQRIGLKTLSTAYLNQNMIAYEEVMAKGKFKNFAEVPIQLATEYAAADAHQTLQLVPILQKKLEEQNMLNLFKNIEMPLTQTLYSMEKEGVIVDLESLKKIDHHVVQDLETIRNKIISFLGSDYQNVNLNSPKQIEEILFVKLGLTPTKKTTKKTGYSTDQEVLLELSKTHPVPGMITTYRELFKLKSTYLDSLPTYINPKTHRIHTTFSQTGTATGRLASSDPNLQNIPVDDTVAGLSIRSAFKAPAGQLFLSADYSQIELRVLAYLSQDPNLIYSFLHNQDIHARTASGLFDVPLEQVTTEQRQLGKRINFSILYGLTPYGLSKDLDITYSQAERYIEKFFAQYPRVLQWMEEVIIETKKYGYVTTLWGMKRYIPGIYERNKVLYDLAHRIAINTKAQGTAAEIMKVAMNSLQEKFTTNNLGAKIALQIHDELLITVPEQSLAETEKIVVQTLQDVVDWNIPLIVSTRSGRDWGDVTK